ncbi:MFS transporter [Arcanobacterium canis]|uniref:MFS transporter n=1 Tax=Arcanobacterium canis TaxID=999183 RepID=A0ABY8FXQ6_9ACTO|nr:MFS transporter [Arcanobacterium canis]WFM83304.1 MFS transporter [Arcanobacterium canis]
MNTSFDNTRLHRNQLSLIALVIIANIAEFFDMFLIGFVVALLSREWSLNGFQAGIILACSGLGTVLGAILWGRLADSLGRRRCMAWCISLLSFFTILSIFVPHRGWALLAVLRIAVGAGVGGLNIVSIPYVAEFVPSRRRGILAGLSSVFIPAGLFLGGVLQAAAGDNWRLMLAVGGFPIFLLVWLLLVPESPKFLISQGRYGEAQRALKWAFMPDIPFHVEHGSVLHSGNRDDRLVQSVGSGVHLPVNAGQQTDSLENSNGPVYAGPYAQLWRFHGRQVLIVSVGTFCFILGSFTIQSWGQTVLHEGFGRDVHSVALIFMLLSLGDLCGRLSAAWLADRIGRRAVMMSFGFLGGCGCALAAGAATSTAPAAWWWFTAGIIIAMLFGDGAFGILNVFGAEQFPTAVRGTGLGLSYGLGATAKVVGPLLFGGLIGVGQASGAELRAAVVPAFLIFACVLIIGGAVYLFARETRGVDIDAL